MERTVVELQKAHKIVGRKDVLTSSLVVSKAGKHILLEGAVGVGKTTIALAVSSHLERTFVRIDGDERYTEQKLSGWFDPPLVLSGGYTEDSFIQGPLSTAMREGSILLINELNRMPEGTQNVLLTAMDEKTIFIPKYGKVTATPGFLLIATQNPDEYIGTSQLSEALKDRFVSIRLSYQPEDEEKEILRGRSVCGDEDIIHAAVSFARLTRNDQEIKRGSSIRGAIDLADIFYTAHGGYNDDVENWLWCARLAFRTKIELHDFSEESFNRVLEKLAKPALASLKTGTGKGQAGSDTGMTDGDMVIAALDEKKAALDTDGLLRKLRRSLNLGDYEDIITLLYRIPSSLNDILNNDYFGELLETIKNMETGFLQVKLLSMIRERADLTRKLEIKRLLLQKITHLSRKIAAGARGLRKTVVANYRPGLDEIDVDRTLEAQLGHPTLEYENIFCHEKVKQKSAHALLLDVSNSMHREKIAVASIATGVFASKLKNDFHGVMTFARDPVIIKHLNEPNNVELLVNRMLDIKSGGATNIRKALLLGLEILNESKAMVKTGILVTDGWATVGGDPVEIASKYDRLHVLGISFGFGGCDPAANSLMAKKGNGHYTYVGDFDDLPVAISKILANRR